MNDHTRWSMDYPKPGLGHFIRYKFTPNDLREEVFKITKKYLTLEYNPKKFFDEIRSLGIETDFKYPRK